MNSVRPCPVPGCLAVISIREAMCGPHFHRHVLAQARELVRAVEALRQARHGAAAYLAEVVERAVNSLKERTT